jgi:hypothetical protein
MNTDDPEAQATQNSDTSNTALLIPCVSNDDLHQAHPKPLASRLREPPLTAPLSTNPPPSSVPRSQQQSRSSHPKTSSSSRTATAPHLSTTPKKCAGPTASTTCGVPSAAKSSPNTSAATPPNHTPTSCSSTTTALCRRTSPLSAIASKTR